jgi:hypothetical protein
MSRVPGFENFSDLAKLEVYGVPEMMKLLKQIDPALQKATVAKMKMAAEPMIREARSLVPDEPPRPSDPTKNGKGWSANGRLGWNASKIRRSITVKYRGTRPNRQFGSTNWTLLKLVMGNAGGSVYDIAGKKSPGQTPQGRALISKLNRELNASRVMWRSAERHLRDVQQGVTDAIIDMEDAINKRAAREKGAA